MHPSTHFSALSSWVLLIAKAVDSYGLDSREQFAKVGLDYNKLRDPVARFSFPAVARLWQLVTETTQDPSFGLTVASFWHPTTLHALGYSWLASKNLEEAFERAVRYSRIVNTAANGLLRIEKSAASYCLVIDSSCLKPNPVPASLDAALAMLMIMSRAGIGSIKHPISRSQLS